MSDVLTKEERELLAEHRGFNAVPSSDFVRTIDRLVAEVERLRRRKLPDDFCARCGIGVYGHCIDAERRGCVDLGGGAACSGYVPLGRSMVAEVARLRARNAALEKVAKATQQLHSDWDLEQFVTPCSCGEVMPCRRQFVAMVKAVLAALSALNPSDPNSSGGET